MSIDGPKFYYVEYGVTTNLNTGPVHHVLDPKTGQMVPTTRQRLQRYRRVPNPRRHGKYGNDRAFRRPSDPYVPLSEAALKYTGISPRG